MAARKGPVNVDDQESIDRFLEQMMRKNYEAAFTSSKPSNTSTTSGNTDTVQSGSPSTSQSAHTKPQHTTNESEGLSEAITHPDVLSAKVNKPQERLAMLLPPTTIMSSANTPVVNPPDANSSITTNKTMQRSRGVSLNAGPDDTLAPHQLPQWMEENCPPSHHSPTRKAPPQNLVDKFLHSPQMSGLQAPPPTPETGPVSQHEITNIIHSAFDELHTAHPPVFTLGDSKYAPRRKSLLGQTRSDLRRSFESERYTPFVTPNRELSSDDRRMRDEGFERTKSQFSSKQGTFLSTPSAVAGGDGKDSIIGFRLFSPSNAGPPPHLRPSNTPISVNEDNNKKSSLNKSLSRSAPATAEVATATDSSQTAYRFDSSSEQDSSQQISKFQAMKAGQQSTSTAKLPSSEGTASLLGLNSSANLNSTGGNWIPPHLRPPQKKPLPSEGPLGSRSYQREDGGSIGENHSEAAPLESSNRADACFVAKTANTLEPSSHNHKTLPPHLQPRKPAIIFTGEAHNVVSDHEAPGSSLVNTDGHNPWQPGQPMSGFLAAPFTPTEQATFTPAGSSTGSWTPPPPRPREEIADALPHLGRESLRSELTQSNVSLKNADTLTSNPFTTTAATAIPTITPRTSKVPPAVAAVDHSLSALSGLFTPVPSMKLSISINTTHPLSVQENPFNGTIGTPRSAVETETTTPSSMLFGAVSPATAAAAGITAAMRENNERPDLEDVLFFKSWPKSDDDRRPGKLLLFLLYNVSYGMGSAVAAFQ